MRMIHENFGFATTYHERQEETMFTENQIEEFKQVCTPVVDFIKKNCCPHDTIIITGEQFKLVSDEIGCPATEHGE